MRILCKTYFDCTATGVTGHFRASQIPFRDAAGKQITCQSDWNHARNQQRNWETLNQLISLRTQPFAVSSSVCDQGLWHFDFEVEHSEVYGANNDLQDLVKECQGVPMVIGLDETLTQYSMLQTSGPDQNIWFEPINN